MKNKMLFRGILVLSLLLSGGRGAGAVNDTIIAIVNDDVITLKDLQDFLHAVYIQLLSEGKDPADIESTMHQFETDGLNKLIEQRLLVNEANRIGMTLREGYIEEKIQGMKKKYPSERQFLDALVKDGMTVSELYKRITEQSKAKFLVDREVRKKIFVNPQEVTQYYQNHPEEFHKPERADLESIFIPFDEPKKTWAITADAALGKLRSGANWEEVAKEYSKAPSIGVVEKGKLLPQLENAIFALNPEDISSALETEKGVYIVKVKAKFPAETAPLEEVKDSIYNQIFQKKFKSRYEEWLAKLRKGAYVEIKN